MKPKFIGFSLNFPIDYSVSNDYFVKTSSNNRKKNKRRLADGKTYRTQPD